MGFPGIPDDLFDGFDWGQFSDEVKTRQIGFVNTLDDETLNRLGASVDGFEASKARTERALAVASGFLNMGIMLGRVVL